ncbi:potassium channel family protein [Paraburkholderia sp. CNPSo 3076]|uniref:potassium channel family protein n=1 Tax=Paraburkholderia sp. CNPSo 3076 TaxID=2940936 RepID=UPI00224F794F|nr:potassium channel family protein [Paraburkholderia sp. CNPSo 3076]MCX5540801.1 potassium channel family protein [Paraburkholderia sp. CNPSo 3076]
MKDADNSAHATLKPHQVVAEFSRALWQLRGPIAFLFVLYLLLSVVMYNFGGQVDSASGLPCSFGEALYLCAMRAITIGQSDIVPTTSVGHIVSVSLGVLGILLVSTVAAAAVRGVGEAIQNAGTSLGQLSR